MAFSGNFMCTSFKQELLEGGHNFKNSGGHTFKLAMYDNNASFTAATTAYTTSNEVSGSGYTAGGGTLTRVDPTTSSTTAFTDFADLTFTNATVTARGALIYNTTTGGGSSTTDTVVVLDFGGDKTSTAGDFTIQFPTADASNAIIRIA
tara:strand:- start:8688 stop:9134 length:447 start_codon:yes stop_codon:yes gene_type:complete